MKEYIAFSLSGINLIPTVLLLLVVFYWLMTIFGFISNDLIDFDLTMDDNINLDTNSDLDSGAKFSSENFFFKILNFSNISSIPFMIYLSIYSIFLWTLSMLTYYFNLSTISFLSFGLFIVNLVGSFILTKIFTNPIIPFFEGLEENNEFNAIGQKGKLTSHLEIGKLGTLLIELPKGREILLNVKCEEDSYKKGNICIVIRKIPEKDIYIVKKIEK